MESICTSLLGRHAAVLESIALKDGKPPEFEGRFEIVMVWRHPARTDPQVTVLHGHGVLRSYGLERVRILPPDFDEVDF